MRSIRPRKLVSCQDRFFSFCVGADFFSAPTQKEKRGLGTRLLESYHFKLGLKTGIYIKYKILTSLTTKLSTLTTKLATLTTKQP